MNSVETVRQFIVEYLARRAREKALGRFEPDDALHMVDSGLLDSFAFLELLAEVEERFGFAVDLSEADPADFLTLGGLSRLAAASAASVAAAPAKGA